MCWFLINVRLIFVKSKVRHLRPSGHIRKYTESAVDQKGKLGLLWKENGASTFKYLLGERANFEEKS